MKSKEQKQYDLKEDEVSPVKLAVQGKTAPDRAKQPNKAGVDGSQPVVVLRTDIGEPGAGPGASVYPAPEPGKPPVHVAPNLLNLVTGVPVTPEKAQAAKEQRDLNEVVHHMLIVGLAVSTVLMLIGLGLDLLLKREVPTAVPNFREVFVRVVGLRPSGFLALGLLVLIATPILRVVGSILAFIYERDWRFAGITFLVLIIVMVSLVLGEA